MCSMLDIQAEYPARRCRARPTSGVGSGASWMEPYPRGFKSSGVFEAEGHEDVVPLAFEVVFCDRSRRSKLVEVVEPGHDLGLVDRFGALLVSALLASFVLGRLAVVALSGDAPLVRAFTSPAHLNTPIVSRPFVCLGWWWPLMASVCVACCSCIGIFRGTSWCHGRRGEELGGQGGVG